MSNQLKATALSKLFLCFPNERSRDTEHARLMIAAYLETLDGFSVETVTAACEAFRRKPSAFAPSSGELFAACKRITAAPGASREAVLKIAVADGPKGSDFERRPTLEEWRSAKARV